MKEAKAGFRKLPKGLYSRRSVFFSPKLNRQLEAVKLAGRNCQTIGQCMRLVQLQRSQILPARIYAPVISGRLYNFTLGRQSSGCMPQDGFFSLHQVISHKSWGLKVDVKCCFRLCQSFKNEEGLQFKGCHRKFSPDGIRLSTVEVISTSPKDFSRNHPYLYFLLPGRRITQPIWMHLNLKVKTWGTPHLPSAQIVSELYLLSNRPGGFGGIDLYKSYKASQLVILETPWNLGPKTSILHSNEKLFPQEWLADGKKFFFSSDGGHPGYWKIRIFRSSLIRWIRGKQVDHQTFWFGEFSIA